MSEKKCPACGAAIDFNANECKYCGESITVESAPYQAPQAPQYQPPQYQPPQYQPQQYQTPCNSNGVPIYSKSKTAAGLLAVFFGGIGVHKFYLGKTGLGILYLLFSWTFVPAVVGLIEGIIYLSSSDEGFYYKYVKH